jgi:transketolase
MSTGVKNMPVGSPEWVQTVGLSAIDTNRRAQLDLAEQNERVFSLEGDLGDCGGDDFKAKFPRRFIDLGIAEANMVGVAAGLAMRGKVPFVNTFATFALMRACEQIRVDVCYHNANVKFAGMFGGVAAGFSGPTHHSIEDIAIARSLPNMVVIAPADAVSAYHATLAAANHTGPVYIRLGVDVTPQVYGEHCPFEIGKGIVLRDGSDVTIVAAGLTMVPNALEAADLLKQTGVQARVIDMHTIKPIDRELIVQAARQTGLLVTVEEHSVIGGLGGAVAEVLGEEYPVPLRILGIPDAYCKEVAPYSEHLRRYGLDAAGIAASVQQALERRR